jgi:hypothetical protein
MTLTREYSNIPILLLEALYNGCDLQELINIGQDLIENPIIVSNMAGMILALSKNCDFDDHKIKWTDAPAQIPIDYDQRVKTDSITMLLENARYPIQYTKPGDKHSWIFSNIMIRDVCAANIRSYSVRRPFNQRDIDIIDILTKTISLELQKGRFYRSNRYTLNSFFLSDLLDGTLNDPDIINTRLKNMNWRPKDVFYILTVPINEYRVTDVLVQITTDQLSQMLPCSISIFYLDAIVFLMTRSSQQLQPTLDYEKLSLFLETSDLTAGLSQQFKSLTEAKRAFNNSLNAVHLAKKLNDNRSLITYDEYLLFHMVDICDKQINVDNFCNQGVFNIINYDTEHGTPFYQTLQCFLSNALNSTATAQELHIHRNTLLYRLDKIKHLANLDFNDGNLILQLLLTIKIIAYQQSFNK